MGAPAAATAPSRRALAAPPADALALTGREAELAQLADALGRPGARLALTGRIGSGRSALATAHAASSADLYPGGVIRLDAARGYTDLALQWLRTLRDLLPSLHPGEGETLQELVRRSWHAMPVRAGERGAVLITLADLPSDERGQGCERLFCRDLAPRFRRLVLQRNATEAAGQSLAVGGLAEEHALALLRGAAPLAGSEEEACRELVHRSLALPFSLTRLADQVRRSGHPSWSAVLERIGKLEAEAVASLPASSPLAEAPLSAAVLLWIWHDLSEPGRRLALLLGAMAAAPVPSALLQAAAAITSGAAETGAGLSELRAAGLVERGGPDAGPEDAVCLHPLVREFLRQRRRIDPAADAAARRAVVAAAAGLTHAGIPAGLPLVERLPLAPLLPHLREVVLRERRQLPEAELLWPALGLGRLLEGLEGDEDARVLQNALEICEAVLGPDHPDTAVALVNLAAFHDAAGRGDARAETLLLRALDIRQRALGPDHAATAAVLARLALVHAGRGEHARAIPLQEEALAVHELHHGPLDPALLSPLNRLMVLQEAHGAHARAERVGRRILEIQANSLGEGHPETATTLQRLGSLQEAQFRPERAAPLYRRALEVQERSLGADHPDNAAILGRLAALALARDDHEEAESLYRRALAILGDDHPEAGRWLQDLARLHQSRGDLAQAERLYREVLALRERGSGSWHPDTAAVLNDLAWLLGLMDRPEEALRLCERALAIRRRSLGAHHLETAASLNTLAGLHEERDEPEEALRLYQEALEISETQLGPDHPGTRTVRANLRGCHESVERLREAS